MSLFTAHFGIASHPLPVGTQLDDPTANMTIGTDRPPNKQKSSRWRVARIRVASALLSAKHHVHLRVRSGEQHTSCRLPAMTLHDRIRVAEPSDAHAIALVQVAGWHAAYRGLMPDAVLDAFTVSVRDAKWQQNLAEENKGLRITVLLRDGRVVAFASSGPCREEPGVGELWALYAAPDAWGTGAGRALLDDALQHLAANGYATATLRVLAGNARGVRFYERAGFRRDGEPFEDGGLMSLRMRRPLA